MFLLRRVGFALLTLWVIATSVFMLFFVANPGDVAQRFAGKGATPEIVALVRARLGLDQSLWEQYRRYIGGLLHADLGTSFVNQEPVLHNILSRLPVTASLVAVAVTMWLLIGIPVGVLAATKPRSLRDRFATGFALAGLSLPTFVIGLVLLYLLFFRPTVAGHPVFPASGYVPFTENPFEWLRHLILPGLTIAIGTAAVYARVTRSVLADALSSEFVRTARSKGLSERRVVYRHALRNAAAPIVTMLGLDIGGLLGGAILTERLFGLNGVGAAAIRAINVSDLPLIMGTVLFAAFFIVVSNTIVDVLYAVLDPRVRAR